MAKQINLSHSQYVGIKYLLKKETQEESKD